MNFKLLAWIVGPILALIVAVWLLATIVGAVIGLVGFIIKAALVIAVLVAIGGAAVWGWNQMRNKLGSGSNNHRQIR